MSAAVGWQAVAFGGLVLVLWYCVRSLSACLAVYLWRDRCLVFRLWQLARGLAVLLARWRGFRLCGTFGGLWWGLSSQDVPSAPLWALCTLRPFRAGFGFLCGLALPLFAPFSPTLDRCAPGLPEKPTPPLFLWAYRGVLVTLPDRILKKT